MSEPPVVAQTVGVFRAFATLAVFLVLRNPQPLRLDTLLAGIRQSTGRAVLESDVALFRGILGARTIDLHWAAAATDSDSDNQDKDGDSPCLFVSLNLARDPDPPAKRPSKRPRKTVAPQPVLLVKQLVDRFSKSLRERISTHQDGDGAAALIDRIARENLPPRPSPPASGLQGAEPAASSVPHLLATLKSSRFYADQLLDAAATTVPAKPASYQALSADIDPAIWSALSIDQLYSHQAQAISAAMQGRSLVLSTSTASGKSTAYQVPLLQRLLDDPQSTFLLIFPTKSLAQDQLQSLDALLQRIPRLRHIKTGTFDGDTPVKGTTRQEVRDMYSVILTNPDTLHASILPNAGRWQRFLGNLKMVVLDEVHVYHGSFGQHAAHIIARLRRLVSPSVQYIACSATASANPLAHMRQLTHTPDPLAIDSDGSAHGTRYLVAWKARPANKQQPFGDTVLVAGHLLRNNMRTLLFCKTRGICELLYMDLQRYIDSDPELAAYRRKVMNYRGGYTPRERREIESALFAGLTSLVVCTNALELGINVGSLDCIVMHGLPYSASSMWQQIGRAGRLMQDSLAIVMLTNDPVDTYAMKAPSLLFQRLPEHLLIASETSITHAHLQCAAFDKPIDPDNSRDQEFIASLGASSALLKSSLLWDAVMKRYLCKLRYKPWPAQRVMIRRSGNSTDEWKVLLLPSLRLLEDLDPMHALFSLYEGGIFLHRGHTYSIDKVDPDARVALVSQTSVSWYTRKRDYREVRPLDTQLSVAVDPGQSRDQCRNQRPDQSLDRCLDSERSASTMPLCALYGRVEIITRVFGYHRVDMQSKKIVETVDHSSPELRSESLGIWIDVPLSICHRLSQGTHDVEASIHAVQHLMIRCIGRLAMGPAAVEDELDTECKSPLATRTRIPRLVVYEKHPVLDTSICDVNGTHAGMGGLAARSLRQISEIMCNALMVVDTCDCKDAPAGCTGCVELRAGCSENNQCLDKQGARLLLQLLLSRDPTLAVDAG